jgi:hypothetical protein
VIRFRTARTRLLATAVLGGAVLAGATGCGSPMQAGAAVVVDGTRTTDAQIQAEVAQATALQAKYGDPSPTSATDLAREQVNWVVLTGLYDQAAAGLGVTPSAADVAQAKTVLVQDARQNIAGQLKAFNGSDDEAVSLNLMMSQQSPTNIAPSGVATLSRLEADYEAVSKALSAKPGVTAETLPTVRQTYLVEVAKKLHPKVSPRYGNFDAAKLGVSAATPAWIRKAPAAAAAPLVQG